MKPCMPIMTLPQLASLTNAHQSYKSVISSGARSNSSWVIRLVDQMDLIQAILAAPRCEGTSSSTKVPFSAARWQKYGGICRIAMSEWVLEPAP